MKTPRKHAELIKAWADGAQIQVKRVQHQAGGPCWDDLGSPKWYEHREYRVKPEPLILEVKVGGQWHGLDPNLRLSFDPETNKLISAEIIKHD